MNAYQKRIKKVLAKIKQEKENSCFLIGSTTLQRKPGNETYPFEQNANFYYLTGSESDEAILLVSNYLNNPIQLFARERSELEIIWEGAGENFKTLAKRLNATLVLCKDPCEQVIKSMEKCHTLYFQSYQNTLGKQVAEKLYTLPDYQRRFTPKVFKHIDLIMTELRMYKDTEEVNLIKEAGHITGIAISEVVNKIKPGVSELELANIFSTTASANSCKLAFETISATGASASILHYNDHNKKLKADEFYMIDCGARYNYYCADVTRTFPVADKLSAKQKALYLGVLNAENLAISLCRPGTTLRKILASTVEELTRVMLDLKLIKGPLKQAIKEGSYKKFFPHGLGHSLGIDTHDICDSNNFLDIKLKAGMVFTIEPGIYIQKKTAGINPLGVRIEDDILITSTGHKNLTSHIPRYLP